ncbi:MAG: hypothetical protein WCK29_03675 [archaeon]
MADLGKILIGSATGIALAGTLYYMSNKEMPAVERTIKGVGSAIITAIGVGTYIRYSRNQRNNASPGNNAVAPGAQPPQTPQPPSNPVYINAPQLHVEDHRQVHTHHHTHHHYPPNNP